MKGKKKIELKSLISYQKVFRGIFWGLFSFLILISLVSLTRTMAFSAKLMNMEKKILLKVATSSDAELLYKKNVVNYEGAKLFAKDFIIEYGTWNFEDTKLQDRVKRMSPFLLNSLNAHAGYYIDQVDYSSAVSSIEVWNIEETEANTCDVTLRFSQILKKEKEVETIVEKTNENGEVFQEVNKELLIEDVGVYERYIKIPLVANDKSYLVRDIPYFVKSPDLSIMEIQPKKSEKTLINNAEINSEVEKFCNAFFKVLTSAEKEELEYYFAKGTQVDSMIGIYEFIGVNEIDIYESGTSFELEAIVTMKDVVTYAEIKLPITCTLENYAGHYVVKELIIR